ncbi:hypothetical protein QG37_01572 [Candidozyma auris]|nr:hypothetical protein QG37_01572 [[Candida] auris]
MELFEKVLYKDLSLAELFRVVLRNGANPFRELASVDRFNGAFPALFSTLLFKGKSTGTFVNDSLFRLSPGCL